MQIKYIDGNPIKTVAPIFIGVFFIANVGSIFVRQRIIFNE